MPITTSGTTITFNDATTQTTSAVTSVSAGTGISVAGGKTPTVTNTGVTSVTAGTGISVSASTGGITITNSAPAGGGVTSLNGQTGAIVDTDLNAIGSYINGRPQNGTSYARNSTIAGTSLYATSGGNIYWSQANVNWFNGVTSGDGLAAVGGVLINTGTWRCMSSAYSNGDVSNAGLWVRIS